MTYTQLLLLLTVIFWGIAPIFDKAALRKGDPVLGLIIRGLVIGISMLLAGIIMGKFGELAEMPKKSMLYFAISGLLAGAIGTLTYFKLLQTGATSKIVPLAATYPLVTALLGVLLLGENLTLYRFLGIILIVFGILLVK